MRPQCFHQRVLSAATPSLTSQKTKIDINTTISRPVATYASETWFLTKEDKDMMGKMVKKNLKENFWTGPGNGKFEEMMN